MFLGLLLVYVLQLTDGTLHSGDELRDVTGLPCFALIPEVGRRALGHLQDPRLRRPPAADGVRRAGPRAAGRVCRWISTIRRSSPSPRPGRPKANRC